MTNPRRLALLVVGAHWVVAVWHLFVAAKVLPAPNNDVSWVAISLITLVHVVVATALWKLGDKLAGWVALIFFLLALVFDAFEHLLHASHNNVFMLATGDWTTQFDVSVFVLLALEITGCAVSILLLRGTAHPGGILGQAGR